MTAEDDPKERDAFDLSRVSERDVALEIARRLDAYAGARSQAPEGPGGTPPQSKAKPKAAPPRATPSPESPAAQPAPRAAPPQRPLRAKRIAAPHRPVPIAHGPAQVRTYTPLFEALLDDLEDPAAERPRPSARRALGAWTRPRVLGRGFGGGFLAGTSLALILALGGSALWLQARDGAPPAAEFAAADLAGPALQPMPAAQEVTSPLPGTIFAAPAPQAATAPPRLASPVDARRPAEVAIQTASAEEGALSPDGRPAPPALAAMLKPKLPARQATTAPAAKPAAATRRAASDNPFDPLLDALAPVTRALESGRPGNPAGADGNPQGGGNRK